MDALEAGRDHRAHAQQGRALGRPVARGARTVFLAGQHDQRRFLLAVARGRVVDAHHIAVGLQPRPSAVHATRQAVAQPNVREGAAQHDFVVAAPRAVRVEFARRHALFAQPLAGGRSGRDRPGRRDMVGGDRVAEQRQDPRGGYRLRLFRLRRNAFEERWAANVGRVVVPGIAAAGRTLQRVPAFVAVEHSRITRFELRRAHVLRHFRLHFGGVRPDIAQIDGMAFRVQAKRIVLDVHVHAPGQRPGHDQGRGGQVVEIHLGMNAPLEVAVAGQNAAAAQSGFLDVARDVLAQGPRIADAGRASVSDDLEAQRRQVVQKAGGLQVTGHHPGTGRQTGLDPVRGPEAALAGRPRQHAGGHHDRRIGGVGATRDGRDQHRAVTGLVARERNGSSPALLQRRSECRLALRDRNPVLRVPGAGNGRYDGIQVDVQRVVELGFGA